MRAATKLMSTWVILGSLVGCATTPGVPHETMGGDERRLYDLMARRLHAMTNRDLAVLTAIYVNGSPEPRQLAGEVFPVVRSWPATYAIGKAESFVVLENDAMARFVVRYSNQFKSEQQRVAAIYEKEGGAWKMTSVTSAQ